MRVFRDGLRRMSVGGDALSGRVALCRRGIRDLEGVVAFIIWGQVADVPDGQPEVIVGCCARADRLRGASATK